MIWSIVRIGWILYSIRNRNLFENPEPLNRESLNLSSYHLFLYVSGAFWYYLDAQIMSIMLCVSVMGQLFKNSLDKATTYWYPVVITSSKTLIHSNDSPLGHELWSSMQDQHLSIFSWKISLNPRLLHRNWRVSSACPLKPSFVSSMASAALPFVRPF